MIDSNNVSDSMSEWLNEVDSQTGGCVDGWMGGWSDG